MNNELYLLWLLLTGIIVPLAIRIIKDRKLTRTGVIKVFWDTEDEVWYGKITISDDIDYSKTKFIKLKIVKESESR